MDPLKLAKNYILGVPERALLFVPKVKNNSVSAASALASTVGNASTTESNLRELAKAKLTGFKTLSAAQQVKTGNNEYKAITATSNYNMLEVQYNPKTLDFRGTGGQNISFTSGLGDGSTNQIQQMDHKVSTALSCELVFTTVNTFDAFMLEQYMGLNLDSLKGAGEKITRMAKGEAFSVQPAVDAIMSLLAQSYTRQVIFAWATTIFRGELTRVDANYKMFNKSGDPIIATINIEIRQGHETQFAFNEQYWRDQVTKVFKEPE